MRLRPPRPARAVPGMRGPGRERGRTLRLAIRVLLRVVQCVGLFYCALCAVAAVLLIVIGDRGEEVRRLQALLAATVYGLPGAAAVVGAQALLRRVRAA